MILKLNSEPKSVACFWHSDVTISTELSLKVAGYQQDWSASAPSLLLFYDDHDLHLRQADTYLVRIAGLTLFTSNFKTLLHCQQSVPGFANEFSDETWQSTLKPLIGVRKLETVLRLKTDLQQLELRDEEQKCVARAQFLKTEQGTYVQAECIRGYDKAHKHLCKLLTKAGFQDTSLGFASCIQTQCQHLMPVPVKVKPTLIKPDSPVSEVVCSMCLNMLEAAQAHEQGVIHKSEDTEFLHEYRVCLRKTRSLVSLMKAIFPVQAHQQIKQQLADIMRPSNEARDLDVYLLDQEDYRQMLPEELATGLPAMFEDFTKRHVSAYKALKAWLSSDQYHKAMTQCLTWFRDMQGHNPVAKGQQPVQKRVNKQVLKKYQKILKLGAAINPDTPDEQVHDLRLECKKFRYLLDFFAPLYPQFELDKLIKKLKKMQNTLGAFNDYSVQQEALHKYLDEAQPEKNLHMSVGALILVLAQKQIEQRQRVEKKFAAFAEPATSELVHSLFTTGKQSGNEEVTG